MEHKKHKSEKSISPLSIYIPRELPRVIDTYWSFIIVVIITDDYYDYYYDDYYDYYDE